MGSRSGLAGEAVGAVARWLLVDQGFERLVLRAAPGNTASQRVAEKAGFMREGVARSAGFTNDGRVDLVVFGLVRSDLETAEAEREVQRARAFYRGLPAKRVASGLLVTDTDGRVLLVRPTYKEAWEIPGGNAEVGESPHDAAAREVTEELGIDVRVGRLLCVDWVPPREPRTDGLMFVFDGGVMAADVQARIKLPPDELSEYRFVDAEVLERYVSDRMARRLTTCIPARAEGNPRYLVDGYPTGD